MHSVCRFFYKDLFLTFILTDHRTKRHAMKTKLTGHIMICLILALTFSCEDENAGPPEALLFNDTIDWGWELGEWYGGNSFYWWHNASDGVEEYGELPSNWKKPNDFEVGNFHLKFEILEQPTHNAFKVQLGFWQDKDKEGGHSETISSHVLIEGGPGTLVTADLGTPSTWWELRTDQPVDFSRPGDFYLIGLALWKAEPLCIPMAQGWSNSNTCENPEQAALEFFPMKARVTVVAVAEGHTFSGWDNYP
jgi:hypothetical protein